jgi:F-type H+-transporting ATPase subunit epsilon
MTMQVEVVSPERILYEGEADMVVARTVGGGDIAFLTGHAAFLGALEDRVVKVRPPEGDDLLIAVHGGFVSVQNNRVVILSDVAELGHQIDEARARAALENADAALASDPDDEAAAAAKARAETRIAAATSVEVASH